MLQHCVRSLYKPLVGQTNGLFHWLNIVFNRVDEDRRKLVGPDRSCAEWLLRNGAYVKWNNSQDFLTDYNKLPCEGTTLYIVEIDASESSIMHYGFAHFIGCNHIKKINFHKCYYIENQALKNLSYLKNSLTSLRVSECLNITDEGLINLNQLINLKELLLNNLPYVKNHDVIKKLQNDLPKCQITFN